MEKVHPGFCGSMQPFDRLRVNGPLIDFPFVLSLLKHKRHFDCPAISVKSFGFSAVKIPLARRRAPERLPKKGFALFERSEFAKPRQHRGAQGIPPAAGQGAQGAFSLVRFFGQAKK
jgi:hypothetical protein